MLRTSGLPYRDLPLTDDLYDYMLAQTTIPADPLLDELARRTRELFPDQAHMQVASDQGALLTFLVRLLRARDVIEVGTFTGCSAFCLARGLPPGGRLLTCDVSAEATSVAREFWARGGVADRIELRLAPAVETLRALPPGPQLDVAFIDADKPGYVDYWEELVPRMRPGALLMADNTLFNGEVLDSTPGEKAAAIRRFNEHARRDERTELLLLPVADGLTLARRRAPGESPR
jgi:caffeoyl-CoA O-methyltransferase